MKTSFIISRSTVILLIQLMLSNALYPQGTVRRSPLFIHEVPDSVFESSKENDLIMKFRQVSDRKKKAIEYHDVVKRKCDGMKNDNPSFSECQGQIAEDSLNKKAVTVEIGAYNAMLKQELSNRSEFLTKQINVVLQSIRSLQFEKTVQDFERWEELSQQQRKTMVAQTQQLAVDAIIGRVSYDLKKIKLLTPEKAKMLEKNGLKLGIDNPHVYDALRKLADAKGKGNLIKAAQSIVNNVGSFAKENLLAEKPNLKVLDWCYEIVSCFTANPSVLLPLLSLKNGYEVIEAYGALYYGSKDVEMLTTKTEADLRNLKAWSDMLRQHHYSRRKAIGLLATM